MPRKPLGWWLSGAALAILAGGLAITFTVRERAQNAGASALNHGTSSSGTMSGGSDSSFISPDLDGWKKRIGATDAAGMAKLFKEAMDISDKALRTKVMSSLITRWMGLDMKGFEAFVDAAEVDDQNDDSGIWSILTPALADALPNLPDAIASNPDLDDVVRRMVAYWARTNPAEALAWVKQWLDGDTLQSSLATIAGEVVKKSPDQALKILEDITASVRRVDAINAIGAVYGETHPAEAVKWAETLSTKVEQPYAVASVLAAMSKVKAADAAKEFVSFRDKMNAAYAVERAADMAKMGMKETDPNESPSEKASDSETLPGNIDPQLDLLDGAASVIAQNMAAIDPVKAMQWTQSLPESKMKTDAVLTAVGAWATDQPQAAYDYYQKNLAADPAPATPIFEAWAAASPTDAANQANQLTNPALRDAAISGVVSGWLDNSSDQAALTTWVNQLPTSRERDIANSEIADATSFDQPQTAWKSATAIQNGVQRSEALKAAFASMLEDDPVSARNLLAETKNLTPAETSGLTQMANALIPAKAKN